MYLGGSVLGMVFQLKLQLCARNIENLLDFTENLDLK